MLHQERPCSTDYPGSVNAGMTSFALFLVLANHCLRAAHQRQSMVTLEVVRGTHALQDPIELAGRRIVLLYTGYTAQWWQRITATTPVPRSPTP